MALIEPSLDMEKLSDKLSYEIFSILESKFLFGYDDPKLFLAGTPPGTPVKIPAGILTSSAGKVRILSIDGGGTAVDSLLAGISLARLESSLRKRSGDNSARIADFFDVAAGSGAGGVLAAMLFTRGSDGRSLFSADEAVRFLAKNRRGISIPARKGIFDGIFRRSGGIFRRIFGEATLRDTVKPVLIPCYDLSTRAPFLFSRADAVETDGYDFRLREVCAATCADPAASGTVEMRSVDGRTRIVAVGGGIAMANPTAAAITHVLNNKQEFPFATGVEDLMVVSLGCGEADSGGRRSPAPPSAAELMRIAGEGVTDMVDQSVAMAFGPNRTTNYVRIQANGFDTGRTQTSKATTTTDVRKLLGAAEEMLAHKNMESVLFRGKKISEQTNAEKIEWFSGELIKEHERRKTSTLPTVVLKQVMTPRTSSATTATTITTTTTMTTSSSP